MRWGDATFAACAAGAAAAVVDRRKWAERPMQEWTGSLCNSGSSVEECYQGFPRIRFCCKGQQADVEVGGGAQLRGMLNVVTWAVGAS